MVYINFEEYGLYKFVLLLSALRSLINQTVLNLICMIFEHVLIIKKYVNKLTLFMVQYFSDSPALPWLLVVFCSIVQPL